MVHVEFKARTPLCVHQEFVALNKIGGVTHGVEMVVNLRLGIATHSYWPNPKSFTNSDSWLLADVLEYKQIYDENNNKTEGSFTPCAGNGCFDDVDIPSISAAGVSVRIGWLNYNRGPGCYMRSNGHCTKLTAKERPQTNRNHCEAHKHPFIKKS